MNFSRAHSALVFTLFSLSSAASSCAPDGGPKLEAIIGRGVPVRDASVVIEGCTVDTSEGSALASAPARRVIGEVIVLCAALDGDGAAGPTQGDAPTLQAEIQALHALGYRVALGARLSTTPRAGVFDPGGQQSAALAAMRADVTWTTKVAANLWSLAGAADEVDLALPADQLDADDAPRITDLARAFVVARPVDPAARTVAFFVPPSTRSPSDVAGGDAFSIPDLLSSFARVRVMTLDFSCCPATAGPVTDPGWAVDAARVAGAAYSPGIDIAYPLYGSDFSEAGTTPIAFSDATAIARTTNATMLRGPTGTNHFTYYDAYDARHDVWFDDALSTLVALGAWNTDVLPRRVGVVFYGLGAEDPQLWDALDRAERVSQDPR